MVPFVIRRLMLMIPILLGVTIITFAITSLTSNPINELALNPRITKADLQRIEHNLGYDRPVRERYFVWLGNLVRGDLGISVKNGVPVRDRIFDAMPNTLLLSGLAIFFSFLLAVPLGIYTAVKRNSFFDRIGHTHRLARAASDHLFRRPVQAVGLARLPRGRGGGSARRRRFPRSGLPPCPAGDHADPASACRMGRLHQVKHA